MTRAIHSPLAVAIVAVLGMDLGTVLGRHLGPAPLGYVALTAALVASLSVIATLAVGLRRRTRITTNVVNIAAGDPQDVARAIRAELDRYTRQARTRSTVSG